MRLLMLLPILPFLLQLISRSFCEVRTMRKIEGKRPQPHIQAPLALAYIERIYSSSRCRYTRTKVMTVITWNPDFTYISSHIYLFIQPACYVSISCCWLLYYLLALCLSPFFLQRILSINFWIFLFWISGFPISQCKNEPLKINLFHKIDKKINAAIATL